VAYDILMGIHVYVEAISLGQPKDIDRVLDPRLVVDAGAGSLDCLPSEDIAYAIVAVSF